MPDAGVIDQDIQGWEGGGECLAGCLIGHIETTELSGSTGGADFVDGALTVIGMNVNHDHRGSGGGEGPGDGGSNSGTRARHEGRFLSKREHAGDYQAALGKSATV